MFGTHLENSFIQLSAVESVQKKRVKDDRLQFAGPERGEEGEGERGGERIWDNNEERAGYFALILKPAEKGDGLDGFSKTHLVCEDDVAIVAPTKNQPL